MKVLYDLESGKIIAIGNNIEVSQDRAILEIDEEINLSEYKVQDGKLVKKTKKEIDDRIEGLNLQKLAYENSLSDLKSVFEDDSKAAKDRITALVNYLKEIKAVR